MAIIEWHEGVWQLFNDHVDYARYEFGEKTANKWLHEMATIDKWLRQFPSDTVHIVDLWDTLQNPATLIQRID